MEYQNPIDDPVVRESFLNESRSKIGIPGEARVAPVVTLNDIRRWAIAVYWPESPPPEFWDETFASTTAAGGIVAPVEMNPFSWQVNRPFRIASEISGRRLRSLNGANEAEYGAPVRPGDVISSVQTLVDVYERSGRSGYLVFHVTEDVWTNQRGEFVKRARNTIIVY